MLGAARPDCGMRRSGDVHRRTATDAWRPRCLWHAVAAWVRYKAGGAQAVAAMAYGTESIPEGGQDLRPGNRHVTVAKQLVSGRNTSIDMPAGPSEVMVMADGSASPSFVAADMLSQAEHGRDSQAMVVCDTRSLAEAVVAEVERQAAALSRAGYVAESLSHSRGGIRRAAGDGGFRQLMLPST